MIEKKYDPNFFVIKNSGIKSLYFYISIFLEEKKILNINI